RLMRIALGGGWIGSLLGSALFSTALIGSEMVIWHHINGYLLCTILCTVSLIALLNHGATGHRASAWVSVATAFLATFAFEVGVVYCVVVAASLAVSLVSVRAP